jgi:hypothetical protein
MVIHGNYIPSRLSLVKFEGDRIRIPVDFVKAAGLSGEKPIGAWFLIVGPGRYRLVTDEHLSGEPDMTRTLRQPEGAFGDFLDTTDNNAEAAMRVRLIPCVVSPLGPGWRVSVPRELRMIASDEEASSSAFLLVVKGFVELWFPETLREALTVPLSRLL